MRRLFLLFLPLLTLATTWAVPTSARAAGGITDNGHFFSAQAIREGEDIIRRNTGHPHSEIRVITVPSVPDELQGDLKSQGKDPFFEHWANDLFKRDRVDGVIILICKNPSHIQIEQGDHTREKIFRDADRRELLAKMLPAFKAKQFDQGVVDGLTFIRQREAANAGAPTPNQPPAPTASHIPIAGFVCLGIVALVVVFLIIGIANRNRNYGGGYGAPPPGGYPPGYSGPGYSGGPGYGGGYGGGGGSGFGKGFLGGLLGGAVGAWGYDKLSGRENNPGTGQGPYVPGAGGGSTLPDSSDQPDTTSYGSGGDFGDSSSSSGPESTSSDSGGGDFGGGGDSGGGDFGGGGDSGGGGGDF
jgi:uncharacterized protein